MNSETPIFKKILNHILESWITIIQIIICIILFVNYYLLSTNSSLGVDEVYKLSGYAQPTDIYNGQYWSLFVSNFLHFNVLHLLFNMYWLYIFGHKIEKEIPKLQYVVLVISAGFVASISELAFFGQSGIGYSGIGYALFGFIYIKAKFNNEFKDFLPQRIINLFFIWLFVCVIITYAKLLNIGNVAHFSGLLWGILIGYLSQIKNVFIRLGLPIFCFVFLSISLFYAPWSIIWLSHKAYEYSVKHNNSQAKIYYVKILQKEKTNEFAKQNLRQIEIYELSVKADKLFESNKIDSARFFYNQILKIDSTNAFALESLKLIEGEQ